MERSLELLQDGERAIWQQVLFKARGVFGFQASILDLGEKWLPLKTYRFYRREGEKGQGRLRVILKLCVIQAVRKL